jgi:hypothetical protein
LSLKSSLRKSQLNKNNINHRKYRLRDTAKQFKKFCIVTNVRETSDLLLGMITLMGPYGSLPVIENSFLILINGMSSCDFDYLTLKIIYLFPKI